VEQQQEKAMVAVSPVVVESGIQQPAGQTDTRSSHENSERKSRHPAKHRRHKRFNKHTRKPDGNKQKIAGEDIYQNKKGDGE
jgi:hypothetical protein